MPIGPFELVICLVILIPIIFIFMFLLNRRESTVEVAAGSAGVERAIRGEVRAALINAIVGIVFFGFVLEPVALYRAGKALRLIRANNIGQEHQAKARTAQIIAIIVLCFWILIIMLSLLSRR